MPRPVVTDSSDQEQILAAEKWQDQERQGFEKLCASQQGRKFLYQLIYETCHYDGLSHVPGDPNSSAFNEGARSVGVVLVARMQASHPRLYTKMIEENLSDG